MQNIAFEKNTTRVNRYTRIDMQQHTETLRPFTQTLISPSFADWEESLTSDEFLLAAKQILRKKFNDRNPIP